MVKRNGFEGDGDEDSTPSLRSTETCLCLLLVWSGGSARAKLHIHWSFNLRTSPIWVHFPSTFVSQCVAGELTKANDDICAIQSSSSDFYLDFVRCQLRMNPIVVLKMEVIDKAG